MSKTNRTFLRRIKRRKFGELLLSQGSITPEQLEEALSLQHRDGGLLGEIMVSQGFITENEVVRSLSTQYGLPVLRVNDYEVDKDLVLRFPPELLYVNLILPLCEIGDLLLATVADLPDPEVIGALESMDNLEVVFYVSSNTDIGDALKRFVPVKDDQLQSFLSARRRKGIPLTAQQKKPSAPKAFDGSKPAGAASSIQEEVAGSKVFSEIDNAWESIFDEAEQNLRQEGL